MIDRTPRVFISYSWTSTKFQQQVKELAERLVHDGVDVVLDIWDLKDGQDKFHFMEQCVTDPQHRLYVHLLSQRIRYHI